MLACGVYNDLFSHNLIDIAVNKTKEERLLYNPG